MPDSVKVGHFLFLLSAMRWLILIGSLLEFISCSMVHENIDRLQDGHSYISFKINGIEFYERDNVFSGDVIVMDQVLRINFYDQYRSNFILSFEEKNNYLVKPFTKMIFADNQMAASVMAGKLADSLTENIGIGYLLTEGIIYVKECSPDLMVLKIKGKGAKFESFGVPEKWEKIVCKVIIKKPKFRFEGVKSNEFYYEL